MRLPNVFGKFSRPNHNSVVATFCHNIANDLPIDVHDPDISIKLIYIDDLIHDFISIYMDPFLSSRLQIISSYHYEFHITIGELASSIYSFKNSRDSLDIQNVGRGFIRSLYSTYVSYLPTSKFSYSLPSHSDSRGRFVEMLKTSDSGQFSFFTALPGITRGGHYHHTKSEKFLVLQGTALFKFKNIIFNVVL